MAKLKVRNFKEDMEISDEQARRIMEARQNGKEPNTWTIGPIQIPSSDIRAIILDEYWKGTVEDGYNLDLPEHRAIIKSFETLLNGRTFEQFCLDERLTIKNKGEPAIVYQRISDYQDYSAKWKGLKHLWSKQEYAEKMEHLEFLAGEKCEDAQCHFCVSFFDRNKISIKDLLKGMKMPELESVAPRYDEIRAEDIPF